MKVLLVVLFSFLFPLECYRLPSKKLSGNRDKWNQLKHFIHAQKFQHSKAQSVQSPLTIVDGVIYTVNITIGTPPQQFLVALDADSSDLIIPASSVNNNGITNTNTTFNSSASSTYQFVGNVTNNGQGFEIGQDTVKLGGIGTSQITIPKTRFLLDINANSFFYYDLGINGVLGIAFESLSTTGGAPPLINAINQGLLSQPILTTYLNGQPKEDNLTTGTGGNVVYGGVNTKNCGSSITYHPLSSASYFQITLSGISVGNYSISKRYQATVNFEQAILGPLNVLDAIANQVGATPTDVEGITYYAIDCNATIPSLNLKIGSNTYSIDEKNLIWNPYDFNDLCFLRLYSMDNGGFGPSWVLGLPLIQQYCTVFDLGNKRIGFSPVKNQ
uniref:Peptidase A1 domain-containing protein n=1 Tax=Acrobeloides nanus TaxID=290746 RepID=A0A914EHA2_9BILA